MNYGILGTGDVACTIGNKLLALGHEVMLGARSADNAAATRWTNEKGAAASHGTFADAAQFGERVFNCVRGVNSLDALKMADAKNLAGKILIDQANPYRYQDGHIALDARWSGTTSLGEEIQKFLPKTKVVKTLNFICATLMTAPRRLSEPVTGFYCGNDVEAKVAVATLLHDFGWQDTMDLGDISMSRYTEMLGAFWPAAYKAFGHMNWGFKLVR